MRLSVDDSEFPFVRMAYVLEGETIDWSASRDDQYFDAMRRLAKRGPFGVVLDLRELDTASMPGPQSRQRIYENASEFYKRYAKKVIAVAMVYNSRMMEMLSTGVGWARADSPKDSRRSFADMKTAEEWVAEKLSAVAMLRKSGS